MDYEQCVIEQFQALIEKYPERSQEIKALASAKGFIYSIVDEAGTIQTTRRSFGSAHRLIDKCQLNFFSASLMTEEESRATYRVVPLHLSQILGKN